ncbi:uncharacterized protein At3g49140 isoform X2 [Cornus florida]|uniref:uncharacterized protein At3g49140 isoform X2 n=1 Tax=Cornus florida TaxID=4283 RepID=UPI00289F012C|nr:uncharacterized protein At3g49140 isoform X2 [Cornus florida]
MVIAAAASIFLEGIGSSTAYGITSSWIKPPLDGQRVSDLSAISFRCRSPLFGVKHRLPVGHDICLSKVSVAADYSDSVPDSSNHMGNHGYHPLEELKDRKRVRETRLPYAEIARTTVEANKSALLIFPGTVHNEPHENISWAEFQYVVDEYGDIFFEISDDENILQDRGASNPVNALFGMDIPIYEHRRVAAVEFDVLDSDSSDGILPSNGDLFEVEGSEMSDISVYWGMPDTFSSVHPIYFAKCLTKSVNMEYAKKMDHPSNGVSILGCLSPAFIDDELHIRRLFSSENSDSYTSDWKDGGMLSFSSKDDRNCTSSTVYRLEIMTVELFSVYGVQSAINVDEFQDAVPDALVHSTPAIVERFCEKGVSCSCALKDLCNKKGLHVEGANLIGVDSLGMDVRVCSGIEVRTFRFPFKVRVSNECKN